MRTLLKQDVRVIPFLATLVLVVSSMHSTSREVSASGAPQRRTARLSRVTRLTASTTASAVPLGTEIEIDVTVRNTSARTVLVQRPTLPWTLAIAVLDANGKELQPLPRSGLVDWALPSDLVWSIDPGASRTAKVVLTTNAAPEGSGGVMEVNVAHDANLPTPDLRLGFPGAGKYQLCVSLSSFNDGWATSAAGTRAAIDTVKARPIMVRVTTTQAN